MVWRSCSLPGEVVAAGDMGQEHADRLLPLPQSHEHRVAIAAAVAGRQRDPLPGLHRQRRQQAVAEIDGVPIPRGRGKEPRHAQSPAQQRRLVVALPQPRPMDFIEGDEVEVLQAIGHAIDVAAAVGARAAVDVERADAEGVARGDPRSARPGRRVVVPSAGPVGCGREASQTRPARPAAARDSEDTTTHRGSMLVQRTSTCTRIDMACDAPVILRSTGLASMSYLRGHHPIAGLAYQPDVDGFHISGRRMPPLVRGAFHAHLLQVDVLRAVGTMLVGRPGTVEADAGRAGGRGQVQRPGVGADRKTGPAGNRGQLQERDLRAKQGMALGGRDDLFRPSAFRVVSPDQQATAGSSGVPSRRPRRRSDRPARASTASRRPMRPGQNRRPAPGDGSTPRPHSDRPRRRAHQNARRATGCPAVRAVSARARWHAGRRYRRAHCSASG